MSQSLGEQVFPVGALGTTPYVNTSNPRWLAVRDRLFTKPVRAAACLFASADLDVDEQGWIDQPMSAFDTETSLAYDLVWHVAKSLRVLSDMRASCAASPPSVPSGLSVSAHCPLIGSGVTERRLLSDIIRWLQWTGITGFIRLNALGDRVMPFQVLNQWASGPQPPAAQSQGLGTLRPIG